MAGSEAHQREMYRRGEYHLGKIANEVNQAIDRGNVR